MSDSKKTIRRGLWLLSIGYVVGILFAPRSGKQTRTKIKNSAKNKIPDVEKELKRVYSQTKQTLDKLARDNPKVTAKLKELKSSAQSSQTKLKELLSAMHGSDNVNEDLEKVLKEAEKTLNDLKDYLTKK